MNFSFARKGPADTATPISKAQVLGRQAEASDLTTDSG